MKTYWSNNKNKEFESQLGPKLIERYTLHTPIWSPVNEAQIVVGGTILECLPSNFSGTVIGIGSGKKETRKSFVDANVLALRGPLTQLTLDNEQIPVLADPALLASDFLEVLPQKKYDIGFIADYKDTKNKIDGHQIHISQALETVIKEISKCEKIVTSSLYGIILADSLHIPRMWVRHPEMKNNGFEFYDYSLSYGIHLKPNVWMSPPSNEIEKKKEKLKKIFKNL